MSSGSRRSTRNPLEKYAGRAFLNACEDLAVQRIAVIEAPSPLGWELRYGSGLVQGTLQAATDAKLTERQPVRPLAHLLLGAIDELAMLVARANDKGKTKRQVAAALDRYLDSLREAI